MSYIVADLQAILNKQPIDLQVTLMDGTNHSISSDACSTSAEIVRSVAEELELDETFGFSLFIAMENKVNTADMLQKFYCCWIAKVMRS